MNVLSRGDSWSLSRLTSFQLEKKAASKLYSRVSPSDCPSSKDQP